MPLQFVAGDLSKNRFKAQALAHGCNCAGSMGAGIAVGFRERYPAMFEEYCRLCKAAPRQFNPGDVFYGSVTGGRGSTTSPHKSTTGATERPAKRSSPA
ncbi:MAG: macro domain-containing protein [Gemmataceae bacterium]